MAVGARRRRAAPTRRCAGAARGRPGPRRARRGRGPGPSAPGRRGWGRTGSSWCGGPTAARSGARRPGATAGPRRPRPRATPRAARPRGRARVDLEHGEGHRPADGRRQAAHPVHLACGVGDVLAGRAGRGQLEDARCRARARALPIPNSSSSAAKVPGHRLAVDGPVGDGARGRETQGPGGDRLLARWPAWRRCPRGWPARCGPPVRPSRRPAPRRGRPGSRRRPSSAAARGRRGTRGRTPTPT